MTNIEDAAEALRAGAPTCTVAEAKAALSRIAAGNNYAGDIRAVRVAIERLDALPTQPADDALDAAQVLVETAIREEQKRIAALPESMKTWTGEQGRAWQNGMSNASRIARAAIRSCAEVRPRGTVTDAEVEAAARAMSPRADRWADFSGVARTALEAAREARS